jgi:Uma2 family endonuclease
MQTILKPQKKKYTPEEYLALEEKAEFRSEYHDGEIIPMTGGSINHNRITGNIYAYIKYQVRGKNKEAFTNDLRVWMNRYQRYVYPDVFIIQGTPILHESRTDTITNPRLIVEVLSKSTQQYDHTEKFRYYRSIPDFQEYLLINQYEVSIEHYIKTGEKEWILREYENMDEAIQLSSIDVEITLNDIYEGVDFALEPKAESVSESQHE